MATTVRAKSLRSGQWIVFDNPRFNHRIVDVSTTRDGQIKVHHDYGDSRSEPAVSFYAPTERVLVA